MMEWFTRLSYRLADDPVLQAWLAAVCTLLLEDPTIIACALLVAGGSMNFWSAFWGVGLGVFVGNIALYLIGRFAGPKTIEWGLLTQERLEQTRVWFDRNLVMAVVLSRFLPGTRLPTYLGAGLFKASPINFMVVAVGASLAWTMFLLILVSRLGATVLPYLGRFKWPLAIGVLALFFLAQWRATKRMKREVQKETRTYTPVVAPFEFWPPALFYFPIALYYVWLALRYRSLTLPSAANPALFASGLVRASKSELMALIPREHAKRIARYVVLEKPRRDRPKGSTQQRARQLLDQAGLTMPLVAKPDGGRHGFGVQLINDWSQLDRYIRRFPPGYRILLQERIDLPEEANVLYFRYPRESGGHIFSVTLKYFPEVVGDGKQTLRELIASDERARVMQHIFARRFAGKLERVLEAGERFSLVFAGTRAQGAILKNGNHLVTPQLLERIHAIAAAMPDVYFARFDLRFPDLESLQDGRAFKILEVNGAAAEATHIWDATTRLRDAYRTLCKQWRILFEIGEANRQGGHRPIGAMQFLKDWRRDQRLVRRYPLTH